MEETEQTARQKRIEKLKAELIKQQDIAEEAQKKISQTMLKLAKEERAFVIPSELTKAKTRMLGPMDDIFFNKMGEGKEAIGEVISTVLGIPITVRELVPQYTLSGIGNRGVRLDTFAAVLPEFLVTVELGADCYLGKKGAMIDIEVQKEDKDDHEYRVYYNGASIVVNNTPRGTKKFADIQRAVVIYISAFDVFGEGEMYYEIGKFSKKSMTPRRSPVTEIYINTENEDRSDPRMSRIADLMKVFKDPERYDFDEFPEFSRRKKELKETEKGVLELSSELQQFVDEENEKASKDTGKLIFYLMKKGRVDDAEKAIEDKYYRLKLLTEFRNGVLGAN